MLKAAVEAGLRVFAPAKINLYLHVTGKRADGYHLLDSLVAFADIGDEIHVEPAAEISLFIKGSFAAKLAEGEHNLVLRAARLLQEKAGITKGARITLDKNLPIASGIGGGSADAAATLRALASLWQIEKEWDQGRLAEIALGLGADVPICIHSQTGYFSNIGEVIDPAPAPLPEIYVLLVNPLIATPTPEIFRRRQGAFSSPARFHSWPNQARQLAEELASRQNDLEKPAQEIVPVIADIIHQIGATPNCLLARMSGSGATCFGLYESKATVAAALQILKKAHGDWWLASGRLLA